MLGAGRASQYAGWWTGKPTAKMTVPVALNQAVYQTPSFSFQYGQNNYNSSQYPSDAVIDLSTFDSVPNSNNKRFALFTTFQLNLESGIAPGAGNYIVGFTNDARFAQGTAYPGTDFWGLNTFVQFRDNEFDVTGRIETSNGIDRVTFDLPGGYEAYNNRWLTFAMCGAESPTLFSNWTAATNTSRYIRTALWDTETRELLQVLDLATNLNVPDFVQYANQVDDLPFNISGEYGMRDQISIDAFFPDGAQPIRFVQQWAAYGTMFDPAEPPDTSMFTTRPGSQLGNAVAWYNTQFVEYVTDGTNYSVKDQGASLYNQADDEMLQIGTNSTTFNGGYSTTEIPKDRS